MLTIWADSNLSGPLPMAHIRLDAVANTRGRVGGTRISDQVYRVHNLATPTYPVATSHIFRVLSRDDDTMKSPDGIKHTEDTLWS